ncbi:MAG: hypothetical protein HQ541_08620, partial [Mariniphaga sp.]|nr:hypothetical protein [Mariniphaga sp.]
PYSLNIKYNQNLINFYRDYPQVNINIYFDAAVSLETKESIVEGLKPIINNMTETEALSFLLYFVQTSFDYQTDEKQFNKEKFFFPEEVFYYPYSDCEDRSVLFAYLVKELLNNKVIGIEYPGHIATAVKLNQDSEGDYLVYDGEKYIIADATFENAPLGMTMPEYRGKEAKIIELDNYKYKGHNNKYFWDIVRKSGGYHGNNLQDVVFDDEGNAYLTGYFMGEAEFGDQTKKTDSTQAVRGVFLVKYDKNGNILWAKNASGNKSATAYAIVRDNNNNLYITGSFSSKLEFEKGSTVLQCKNDNNDVFIAKYNNEGKFIWAKKAGLDTFPQDNYLTYLTNFTTDGINKGTTFYSENESYNNYGLYLNPDGLLYLIGSFSNTTGLNLSKLRLETREGKELNLSESLKAENDKLIADDYEVNIAGLFSLLNLMKYNGLKVEGKEVQSTLNMYNPEFREKYSDVYQDIGKINLLINEDGIISIKTKEGKSVNFDKMKVTSNSKVKITSFESGDAQIDILSGITAGKFFIWFDINFVKIFKETGDMLIDFDTDHSQKVINLKEDILE